MKYWIVNTRGKVISCFSITKSGYTTSWLLCSFILTLPVDLLCARPCAVSWACGLGWMGYLCSRSLLDGLMEKAAHTETLKNHRTRSHTKGQIQRDTCWLEKSLKGSCQDQNDQVNAAELFPKFYLSSIFIWAFLRIWGASPSGSWVKNLPAMQEM